MTLIEPHTGIAGFWDRFVCPIIEPVLHSLPF